MKNKISKKNAVIIAGAIVAVTAVGGTAYAMSGPKLALNKEKVTVEYGTQYKPELKDIVKDYKDFDKKSLKLINKIPNEKDKTYPAVGKYTITVKYKKNSLKQSVIVKDTKAPEVAVPADIEILQGTDLATFDFKSLMNVSDASETTIDVDTSKVDVNTPAQYDINVTVTAKPEISDDEQVVQETVKNSDGTTAVRNSVQKKSQSTGKKVLSNSSNSSQSASGNRTSRGNKTSGSSTNGRGTSGSSNKTSGGNRTSGSSKGNSTSGSSNKNSGSSSSGSHQGSMTYEDDPKYHWEGENSYGDGAEISGEDFDKLTGGDWKNWNY